MKKLLILLALVAMITSCKKDLDIVPEVQKAEKMSVENSSAFVKLVAIESAASGQLNGNGELNLQSYLQQKQQALNEIRAEYPEVAPSEIAQLLKKRLLVK